MEILMLHTVTSEFQPQNLQVFCFGELAVLKKMLLIFRTNRAAYYFGYNLDKVAHVFTGSLSENFGGIIFSLQQSSSCTRIYNYYLLKLATICARSVK